MGQASLQTRKRFVMSCVALSLALSLGLSDRLDADDVMRGGRRQKREIGAM